MKLFNKFSQHLASLLPIIAIQQIKNEWIITLLPEHLLLSMNFLKKHIGLQYSLLSCISGVDFLGKDYRFCVSYDLLSLTFAQRLRVKAFLNEITPITSVVSVFPCANWWEREIWDMYGIFFENHPDLRRILTDYNFLGSPLRKDFPLNGYLETRFDTDMKMISIEPVELSQELREFRLENP